MILKGDNRHILETQRAPNWKTKLFYYDIFGWLNANMYAIELVISGF